VKKVLPILVAGALVLTLGLSGCGTGGGNKGGSANPAVWDVNEQPRDKIKDGGVFRGAFGTEITSWNIHSVRGNPNELRMMQSPLSELWYLEDGGGNHTMNTNFLDSVVADMVDGQLVVTMKISDQAQWNDGTPIGFEDWDATVKALNGENEKFAAASTEGWDQIDSVTQGETAKDVILTFKAAYPDWVVVVMAGPLHRDSCVDPATFNDGWNEYNMDWYAGPFIVTDFAASPTTITMERNPNWWGDPGKLDTIIWKYVSPNQWGTAFANGELDYIDVGTNTDVYDQADKTKDTVIRKSAGPNYRHITFNSLSPVLSDQLVRQAIVMGINRDEITASDLAGLPVSPQALRKNSNLFIQGQEGYKDWADITGIKYDPRGAKAKLEEAGYEMGEDGYFVKGGEVLAVSFAVLRGVRVSENEGQMIQDQLREIGIRIDLQNVNTATDFPGIVDQHNFDMIAFSWMGSSFPLMGIGQLFGEGSEFNHAQLTTPLLEELRPLIDTNPDPIARLKQGQEVDQALWENVHTLPLYQRPTITAVRAGLANFGSFGLAQIPYTWTNVGYVK